MQTEQHQVSSAPREHSWKPHTTKEGLGFHIKAIIFRYSANKRVGVWTWWWKAWQGQKDNWREPCQRVLSHCEEGGVRKFHRKEPWMAAWNRSTRRKISLSSGDASVSWISYLLFSRVKEKLRTWVTHSDRPEVNSDFRLKPPGFCKGFCFYNNGCL